LTEGTGLHQHHVMGRVEQPEAFSQYENRMNRLRVLLIMLLLGWIAGSGCSLIRRAALDQVADAVAGQGSTFASDDDPDLVKAAVPFSLKLLESLLAESPNNQGLLVAAASGFTQYAFAFVQQDADELEARDLAAAEALRTRARRLYLRAQRYGLRGLEASHAGFSGALLSDPRAAVRVGTTADVPLLYWTAAAWGGAISLSKDHPELVAQIPAMEALIDRALELDDSYGRGAIHGFLITYEMSRQGAPGDPAARARAHFDRAMVFSEGRDASPLVALAEAVAVQQQDAKEFESLLERALAIDPDAHPDTRLQNMVMQRRARWLLSRKAELFLLDNE
jgi:predicted anti-sigma-YlaC factor YlaD